MQEDQHTNTNANVDQAAHLNALTGFDPLEPLVRRISSMAALAPSPDASVTLRIVSAL